MVFRRRYRTQSRFVSGRFIGLMGVGVALVAYVLTHLPTSKLPDLAALKPGASSSGGQIAGIPRIVDGDTIKIGATRIRLYGIDAPEHRQFCRKADGDKWPCGIDAGDALQARIGGKAVSCTPRDTDRYGRTVAVCFVDGVDLNGWMVQSGWAIAYRQYSRDYVGAEEKATAAHVGIWAGTFEVPSDWRREHRRG